MIEPRMCDAGRVERMTGDSGLGGLDWQTPCPESGVQLMVEEESRRRYYLCGPHVGVLMNLTYFGDDDDDAAI